MNAAMRLLLIAASLYIGGQIIRWEPALGLPLGLATLAALGAWTFRAYQAAAPRERELNRTATEHAARIVGHEILRERHEVKR